MGFKSSLKQLIRASLETATNILGANKVGRIMFEQMVNQCMQRTQRINHQGLEMCFSVPNELNHFRATTFSTKEPETLEWIDGLPEGCVL